MNIWKFSLMSSIFLSVITAFALSGCSSEALPKLEPYKKREILSKAVVQDFRSAVDILFIIDDSGSMQSHQNRLARNMNDFVQAFFKVGFIDYHIGVTTSSPDQGSGFGSRRVTYGGKLRRDGGVSYIERSTVDGQSILNDYIRVGTSGDYQEHFLDILTKALDPSINFENQGFLRADSHVLVVFLTDTDDQSGFTPSGTLSRVTRLLNNDISRLNVATALAIATGANCRSEMYPSKLEHFTQLVNGKIFELCSEDYGEPLALVAQSLVGKASTISLEQIPDLSTLVLTYGSQVIPEDPVYGWSYNAETNQIFLGGKMDLKPEPKGTSVQFFYEPVY